MFVTNFCCSCCRYFKFELEGKGAIQRANLPPFLSVYLDRSSPSCMYMLNQLRTFTTAHLSSGGWYIDCPISYTHPSEVQLRKSLEGIGVVDMEVDDFASLTDAQRARAVAKRENSDRKKTARLQIALENKQKESDCLAKLEEKEKEKQKEKEEKAKAKGKKVDDGNVVVPTSSMADQSSHLVEGTQSGMKRKAALPEWTEEMVTQGTLIITLDDEDVKSEELILNASIVDIMDSVDSSAPNSYVEVMDFIRKVCDIEVHFVTRVNFPPWYIFHASISNNVNNHSGAGKCRISSVAERQDDLGAFGGSYYF